MKQLHTLEIDEEFHKLCPKQTKEAREQLRANLKADGCLDAIKVWGGIVVDGMTRYQLCHEEKIPFLVEQMQFADNDAARDWIIKHQLGRRNLTESQASELRGRLYQERKKPRGDSERTDAKNQKTPGISPKRHNVALGDTAAEVAQETGVNRRTVQRDAKYVEALDSVPEPIQEAARDDKLSKKEVQRIAGQPAFVQEVIAESIKAGEEPKEAVKKATEKKDESREAWNKELESYCRRIMSVLDDCPRGAWIDDSTRNILQGHLKSAAATVRLYKCPHDCHKCGGKGCKLCRQTGWMTKRSYEMSGGPKCN